MDQENKLSMSQIEHHKTADKCDQERHFLQPNSYKLIKVFSKGIFGEVRVVRNRYDHIVYTMKVMKEKCLIAKNRVCYMKTTNVMFDIDYAFLVKSKHSFRDDTYSYLVTEYYPGNLMSILTQQHILTENQTIFYMSELAAGINAIHEIDYVHRDLKPENILITNDGHIKLSDYDLSKSIVTENDEFIFEYENMKHTIEIPQHVKQKNKSCCCETKIADYMAPEVFSQKGYDKMVDWWSMGIIMYECLIGYTPFHQHGAGFETCKTIIHYRKYFKIPHDVNLSRESVDLMKNLICSYRRRYSFDQIKNHAFFKQIEFNNLKSTKPPFIPTTIDILIIGYIQTIQRKFQLFHDVPHGVIKLIVALHGSCVMDTISYFIN